MSNTKRIKRSDFKTVSALEASFLVEYLKDRDHRRAAEFVGWSPDEGYKALQLPRIQEALTLWVTNKLDEAGYDAEWLLHELVDNHRIARQQGNITASNKALHMLMQHVDINALAAAKMEHSSPDGSMRPVMLSPEDVRSIADKLDKDC